MKRPAITAVQTPRIEPIGEYLVATGRMTADQLAIALHEQRKTGELIGRLIVRLGFLSDSTMADALAEKGGWARASLSEEKRDFSLLERLTKDKAKKFHTLPLTIKRGVLRVAIADPADIIALDALRLTFPEATNLVLCIAGENEILTALTEKEGALRALDGILFDLENERSTQDTHPVIRLAQTLIDDAVRQNASDIHIEPDSNLLRVRFRLDGVLRDVRSLHKTHAPALTQRIKLLGGMNIADQRSIQDGRFHLVIDGATIDFRVAVMPTQWGENIVIRILDQRRGLMSLSGLGFRPDAIERLTRIIERPQGLTLVTGPTGSGKSTTLYAILSHLNSPEVNIATLEEPIEYHLDRVRQTAIAEEQGLTFATGIRAILRQDPDIILIGEIRDTDTAQMALRAAMTGHRVFATLHCNDVWGAVPRLLDLGLTRSVLSGHLCGIIAQRLVRKLCASCKIPFHADAETCRLLGIDPAESPRLYEAMGCPECTEQGRKGRIVLSEILDVSQEIDDAILDESSRSVCRELALAQGFESLKKDGIRRVLDGEVALADLRRCIDMTRS